MVHDSRRPDNVANPRQDERVTQQVFSSYQSGLDYGGLDYTYDADGRVIDKGNTLAAVSLPPSDTASYSPTDQLSLWNGAPTSPDPASNITSDPVLGLSYTWDARNDLTKISGGVTEEFDTLGRRAMSTSGTHSLSLIHDGSSVIGSFDGISRNTWTFLPGGLAGSLTSGGNTATWVPLLDLDGSTIALVNATQTQPPAATTFTYDPSGVSTVTGLSNSFPFLYQGLEHEVSDPGQLYFEPSGNVYNPQIQRELSQPANRDQVTRHLAAVELGVVVMAASATLATHLKSGGRIPPANIQQSQDSLCSGIARFSEWMVRVFVLRLRP